MEDESDPISHYLNWLSPWDGNDRIDDLACRIVTDNDDWPLFFHRWLLQTVAIWMDDDTGFGDGEGLQPVLTEADSQWASLYSIFVVPPELRDFYITRNAEFRRRSGNCWIKTTIEQQPISNATDMRRLICIAIDKPVNLESPADHGQIFAQLKEELAEGTAYRLEQEEQERLVARNAFFQDVSDLRQMILETFRSPAPGEKVKAMKVDDIIAILAQEFPNIPLSDKANQEVGNLLKKLNFERKRINTGSAYVVVKRKEESGERKEERGKRREERGKWREERGERRENSEEKGKRREEKGNDKPNPLAAALLEGLGIK